MLAEITIATQGKTPDWATLVRPTFSLTSSILSTLRFGDPSLLSLEAEWLCTFLKSRRISISVAEEYLILGLTVVQSVLGSDSSPVTEMLERLLKDVQRRFYESA